jgi:hypothetical protein
MLSLVAGSLECGAGGIANGIRKRPLPFAG